MTAPLTAMRSSSQCVSSFSIVCFEWLLELSTVLDPGEKAAYVENHWAPELQVDALELARSIVSLKLLPPPCTAQR